MRRLAGILLSVIACAALGADRLRGYDADRAATTVSGLSSGGYMAVQFHVAHSASVAGVGVLAAGPFYCAQGSVLSALYNCMEPSAWAPLPPVTTLKSVTDAVAKARAIDPTTHLAHSRAWLFSGSNDHKVERAVVESLKRYYEFYVPATQIAMVTTVPAGHAMVTNDTGNKCDASDNPYINACKYDAAGNLLTHLYGTVPASATKETGRLLKFDQQEFAAGDAYAISMADTAYVYVPAACNTQRCRIHVALHGCRQNVEAVDERFVREAGYNRWADAHKLIVLYPQTIARRGARWWPWNYVYNPKGCWDWWGYTGANYHVQSAPQIRALKAMVERVTAPR